MSDVWEGPKRKEDQINWDRGTKIVLLLSKTLFFSKRKIKNSQFCVQGLSHDLPVHC